MKPNILSVFVTAALFLLSACSLDVNVLGKNALPSLGGGGNVVGPTTTLPVGARTVTFAQAIGKNRWVGLDRSATVSNGPIIDSSGNITFSSFTGFYTYTASGVDVWKKEVGNTVYPNWTGYRTAMARSANGNLYVVSRIYPLGNHGLLEVTPAGVITEISLTGGTYSGGADDMALATISSTEELLILPYTNNATNDIEVYGFDGVFKRTIGSGLTNFTSVAQNPVDGSIWALSGNNVNNLYKFLEDGTPDGMFVMSASMESAQEIDFDASGRMYLTDAGDNLVAAGLDTSRGVVVFDVTGVTLVSGTMPVVVRELRTSLSHPIAVSGASVSPDGNKIIFNNIVTQATQIDEEWAFNSGTNRYEYVRDLNSRGSGISDFNNTNTSWGFAVDGDQNIYVDDNLNKRVKVYSKSGAYLRQFSVDNPGITWWDDHFVAATYDGKIVTGGYQYSTGAPSAKVFYQVRDLNGVEESAIELSFSGINGAPKFMGIDSKNQLWFNDGSKLYHSDIAGNFKPEIDYASNPAVLGVAGVLGPQAIGDKVYYLNTNYTLWAYDVNTETYAEEMSSADYTAAGLFLVYPVAGSQPLADGKFVCFAYDNLMAPLFLVLDPKNNYSIVSQITGDSSIYNTMGIWTSQGLVTKGTFDRLLFWNF